MRDLGTSPAKQLKSVSLRYRCARRGDDRARSTASWLRSIINPAAGAPPTSSSPALSTARDDRLCRLEAVLFLAREPLTTRKLAQFAQLDDGTEARTLVRRLNKLYDEGRRAFRVEEVAGGYQLLSRPKLAPWLRRLQYLPPEARLSVPAMETLAVIAYRQPVLRADIEAIRGVNCGEILRQLMERDLVRIEGRSEELGRPYLYATTKRFLQTFGLYTLDQLPRADVLKPNPANTVGPATVAIDPANHLEEWSKEDSDVSVITAREYPHPEQIEEEGPRRPLVTSAADEEEELEEELDDEELDDDEDYEYYDEDEEEEDDELDEGEEAEDEDYDEDEWEEVDDDEEEEWEDEEDDEEDVEWDDDEELDEGEEAEEEEDEETWD